MENQTYTTEFLLQPFSTKSDHTSLAAGVFFSLYTLGILSNSIIITVIYIDDQLHTPMYLFLCNLALVDICYTTTTVPNLLYMLLCGDNSVSFIQCFTQMYFYAFIVGTEDVLLFIMAYDRYVAIRYPLSIHYHSILNRKNCLLLASGNWITGSLNSLVITIPSSYMSFCYSRTIHQFFCDPKALINISCPGNGYYYIIIYMEVLVLVFFPIMFSVISYVNIIKVILKIKSKDGRNKTFSTCSSHFVILMIYYITGVSVYMLPPSEYSNVLEQVFTALYAVVTPMINPLIYSLPNKYVKRALQRLLGVKVSSTHFQNDILHK